MSDAVIDLAPDGARGSASLRPAIAVLLVVLGLGLCVLWRIASGTEQHSWDRGAVAPADVELTVGHSYAISIPGGVATETENHVSPNSLMCAATAPGIGTQQLTLAAEPDDSKATEQIASFVSPVTGSVDVSCRRLTSVFVDDSDGAGFDFAGVVLWLGVLALAVGLPIGLSVLRESLPTREDDEIE